MRYIDTRELLSEENIKSWGRQEDLWKNQELKRAFRELFHGKCWYTEGGQEGEDGDIDHFRPKADLKKYKHYEYNEELQGKGYPWLRNDVTNYRFSCISANRPRGDGGKASYFPLMKNSPHMTEENKIDENPMLLDPCVKKDVKLLTFCPDGRVGAATFSEEEKERVQISKELYNLDYRFPEARKRIWQSTSGWIENYMDEGATESVKERSVKNLKDYISREAPYSACAIACVNSLASDELKEKLGKDLEL